MFRRVAWRRSAECRASTRRAFATRNARQSGNAPSGTRETFDNFIAEGMQMVEDAYSEGLAHGSAEIYSTKDGDDRVWCFDQEDLKKHLLQAQAPEVGDRNEDAYIDQYYEDKYDLGDFNYDTTF